MKEFDKIYIAKYYKAIENWQICKDLKIKNDELEIVVKELKEIGLYEIYRNMSDYEWETLERKSDLYILKKYCPQIPGYYSRIFNKVIDVFKEELVTDYKYQFEKYKTEENTFNFDYFKEGNFDGEEWKQIGKLNYEVSNYGRIKNTKTKN